jgi:hypothetical protein
MTGGQLIKCLEEGDSALTIINAFVQCLKYNDLKQKYSKVRIIIPPQNLVSFLQQTYLWLSVKSMV